MNRTRSLVLSAIVLLTATLAVRAVETTISEDGHIRIKDLAGGATWDTHVGQVVLNVNGQRQTFNLKAGQLVPAKDRTDIRFHPWPQRPNEWITVTMNSTGENTEQFTYSASPGLPIDSVRLLDDSFPITASDKGYALVPCREGLLIPSDSGVAFSREFGTYDYEGCHMRMIGLVKNGSAALITWEDPYIRPEIRSTLPKPGGPTQQTLTLTMNLRKSAKSFKVTFLGKGDWMTIANAYRQVAKQDGWLVTWDQKLKENPHRSALFGASNVKLWSTLSRQMNEDSTREIRHNVNWTFDEAAQVAEHLKNDLKLDNVHFIIGGWIHRGYDNQHPDILPAAPECGGDEGLADCARRVRALGYLFDLHDNYQDMYKDSPSWNEDYLQKTPDGKPARGGHWAGGVAWITCSKKALELAKRPQNLEAVKKLTNADAYFIDTTYAAGLQECFDPKHPLTKSDDMHWKQELSDYARSVFGIFGSECGREWAIPHADYFEGLTGVSGTYYHQLNPQTLGATVIPLFELVYRDCIAMYGKYGYDINNSAEYVAHHISIGRTLNYHSIPQHLYWKNPRSEEKPVAATPSVAAVKQLAPRRFEITYAWNIREPIPDDYTIFVHFTDAAGKILFQGDYRPDSPTSTWQPGALQHGPFTVTIPDNLPGPFDIRIGMFKAMGDSRVLLSGRKDRERRCMVGQLRLAAGKLEFIPPAAAPAISGDPAMYVRADNGWAAGMHPMDRFLKNTHELLSPLNKLTAQMRMTGLDFLTPDRKVRRTTFGEGDDKVEVVVNFSGRPYPYRCPAGGNVLLPPDGFVITSPTFIAFCALSWNDIAYDTPTLFTLRALDAKPIPQSRQVRIFHAFGDSRLKLAAAERKIEKETIIDSTAN